MRELEPPPLTAPLSAGAPESKHGRYATAPAQHSSEDVAGYLRAIEASHRREVFRLRQRLANRSVTIDLYEDAFRQLRYELESMRASRDHWEYEAKCAQDLLRKYTDWVPHA